MENGMPGDIYDIVVVLSDSDRSTQFPTPGTNQRVQNLGTGNIERYNGTAWVTDFVGDLTIISNPSTTDYGPAIKAAIATANAAGGGTVYIPAGTWPILTTIDFQSATNVTLRGAGFGTTLACQMASPNAGGILASSTTRCAIRGLRMTGAGTSTTLNGLIFAQGATQLTVDSVRFENGGNHINMNNCTYSTVSNTSHNGLTVLNSNPIFFYQCSSCSLINPIISGFVYPTATGGTPRAINIANSTNVSVVGGSITDVDFSNVGGGVGITFYGSQHCTLTGMTVNGLMAGDGINCESSSSYISISNCNSSNNNQNTGAGGGTNPPVGDGFDIFNSSHIRISNCVAYNNGKYGDHPGFEIFTCSDVTVSNCLSQGNTNEGFVIVGTPDCHLNECVANGNGTSGVYCTNESGPPDVESTDFRVTGGDYSGNNVTSGNTQTFEQCGIYLASSSTGAIVGARATDTKTTKTQQYGIYVANSSYATIVGCQCDGNAVGSIVVNVVTGTPRTTTIANDPVSVTGAKGGNAALASLLSALQGFNIITDNTTA
jgi:hypothetical protein